MSGTGPASQGGTAWRVPTLTLTLYPYNRAKQRRARAGEDAMALIACGAERRRSAATAANADSSRSHAVLACQARPAAARTHAAHTAPRVPRRRSRCPAPANQSTGCGLHPIPYTIYPMP